MKQWEPSGVGPTDKLWVFLLGPAMAMLLGWGLRGFIGGGPLGAMIPGAMVALLFCLMLKLDERDAALLTAIGAIGIGLGGQMTYGQTIGLMVQADTFWWGLLGLSVKGGVWGLSGGALLGMGLVQRQIPRRDFAIGLVILLIGVVVGWQLINVPKLIYFSFPHDKPRAEIWAGVLIGTLALLGWLAVRPQAQSATDRLNPFRIALRFALWGAVGGAIGFGGGGLWMVLGRAFPELKQTVSWWRFMEWWKFMEFTFGFCFGLTLGIAAWLHRAALRLAQTIPHAPPPRPLPAALVILATLWFSLAVLWCEASVDVVCAFTFLGVALLLLCRFAESFAWQVGLTLTIAAFVYDLVEHCLQGPGWLGANVKWWAAVFATVGVAGLIVLRLQRNQPMVRWSFLVLTWSAVVVSYLKSLGQSSFSASHSLVELIFTLSAVWVTWLVARRLPPPAITHTAGATGLPNA